VSHKSKSWRVALGNHIAPSNPIAFSNRIALSNRKAIGLALRSSGRLGVLVLGLLGMAAGCQGAIGTDGAGGGSGNAVTSSGAGTGASSGAAGGLNGGSGLGPGAGSGAASVVAEPGRVTMRRLNQVEYDNTVHDLLGTNTQPALLFLSDTQANGFDNNGDQLGLSPVRMDQYRQAAEALAQEALTTPALRANVLTCDPTAGGDTCLTAMLTTFGARAYRRPLTTDEVTGYLSLAAAARAAGAMPDEVVSTLVQAILVSPHFLFRVEIDPNPTSLTPHPLGPYELASRLSYMIYASLPDTPLFVSAQAGHINDPTELQAQLTRMLADPKARLSQNFAEQWLGVRAVDTLQPDATLFPSFNAQLGQSMKQEVDLFFGDFIKSNLPLEQLLTASFTYVDGPLAKLYGLPSPGTSMTRVDLSASPQRGGLLTMGALLMATSRGNRTSPVSRGKFTLSELLCAPTPPPPPTVVFPPESVILASSARDFLAQHRNSPTCAACHNQLDPVGLSLENYDAIGAFRTMDHGQVIDASGTLPDGTTFMGARGLSQRVASDPRYRSCVASALLTYSLGRTLSDTDTPYTQAIAGGAAGAGAATVGLRDLIARVVASDPFRQRRGEP